MARRRRLVAGVLALAVLVVTAAAVCSGGPAGGEVPSATSVTVVGAGESLSDVARRAVPDVDPAVTVVRIRELNGLRVSVVAAGRPLVVPAGR